MDAVHAIIPTGFEQAPPAESAGRPTPVMEQYIEIKAANPDCLLFYRMGDFYELFFEDAELAARALGIVLTKRGKHLGRDIPMCGVPVHRADEYLQRLIIAGHRVAECARAAVTAELARLDPSEIIVSDALYADAELGAYLRSLAAVRPLARDVFDGATAERRLASYFGLSTTHGFGALSRLELTAAAACITYVERTQLGERPPLAPPVREREGTTLLIDQATRSNLELARTLAGERRGTLLDTIDRAVTAAGSRLLV